MRAILIALIVGLAYSADTVLKKVSPEAQANALKSGPGWELVKVQSAPATGADDHCGHEKYGDHNMGDCIPTSKIYFVCTEEGCELSHIYTVSDCAKWVKKLQTEGICNDNTFFATGADTRRPFAQGAGVEECMCLYKTTKLSDIPLTIHGYVYEYAITPKLPNVLTDDADSIKMIKAKPITPLAVDTIDAMPRFAKKAALVDPSAQDARADSGVDILERFEILEDGRKLVGQLCGDSDGGDEKFGPCVPGTSAVKSLCTGLPGCATAGLQTPKACMERVFTHVQAGVCDRKATFYVRAGAPKAPIDACHCLYKEGREQTGPKDADAVTSMVARLTGMEDFAIRRGSGGIDLRAKAGGSVVETGPYAGFDFDQDNPYPGFTFEGSPDSPRGRLDTPDSPRMGPAAAAAAVVGPVGPAIPTIPADEIRVFLLSSGESSGSGCDAVLSAAGRQDLDRWRELHMVQTQPGWNLRIAIAQDQLIAFTSPLQRAYESVTAVHSALAGYPGKKGCKLYVDPMLRERSTAKSEKSRVMSQCRGLKSVTNGGDISHRIDKFLRMGRFMPKVKEFQESTAGNNYWDMEVMDAHAAAYAASAAYDPLMFRVFLTAVFAKAAATGKRNVLITTHPTWIAQFSRATAEGQLGAMPFWDDDGFSGTPLSPWMPYGHKLQPRLLGPGHILQFTVKKNPSGSMDVRPDCVEAPGYQYTIPEFIEHQVEEMWDKWRSMSDAEFDANKERTRLASQSATDFAKSVRDGDVREDMVASSPLTSEAVSWTAIFVAGLCASVTISLTVSSIIRREDKSALNARLLAIEEVDEEL